MARSLTIAAESMSVAEGDDSAKVESGLGKGKRDDNWKDAGNSVPIEGVRSTVVSAKIVANAGESERGAGYDGADFLVE